MVAPDYPAVAPVFALSVKWQSERHALNDFHIQVSTANFHENFIFANSVKRHICDAKNSGLGHDFPLSVNDRVISLFARILFTRNFEYVKFGENNFLIYSIC